MNILYSEGLISKEEWEAINPMDRVWLTFRVGRFPHQFPIEVEVINQETGAGKSFPVPRWQAEALRDMLSESLK